MTYEQTLSPVAITEGNALQVALDAGLTLVEVEQSMAKGIALTEIAASAVRLRDQGLLRGLDECQVRLPLTLERLIQALSELKITVRLNLITREMEVLGLPAVFNPEGLAGNAHIILHDLLKRRYRCTKDLVADLLGLVAGQNRYNPVLDYFQSLTWDERDRMLELFSILGLRDEDWLSMELVMKWSLQCVAMAANDLEGAYGADGVLVLQGPQGIGKTTFARTMAVKPMFFKAGQYIDPRDKDTTRRLTSTWIAELGEVFPIPISPVPNTSVSAASERTTSIPASIERTASSRVIAGKRISSSAGSSPLSTLRINCSAPGRVFQAASTLQEASRPEKFSPITLLAGGCGYSPETPRTVIVPVTLFPEPTTR